MPMGQLCSKPALSPRGHPQEPMYYHGAALPSPYQQAQMPTYPRAGAYAIALGGTPGLQIQELKTGVSTQAATNTTSSTTSSSVKDGGEVTQPENIIPPSAAAAPVEAEERDNFDHHVHLMAVTQPQRVPPYDWTRGKLIGAGAFGQVWVGLDNVTGGVFAVKQVALTKDEALRGRVATHVRALESEVMLLKELRYVASRRPIM
jgi:hypothetical protein